ncbi:CDC45 like horizontal transfer [Cryptosporidium xiaoi]|uniref:CDC45 like horizontal transfer n=1 Tax=Cryptosporidium xiaoi TaxID=659607 RepID=A0AAV9XZN2_9CRYT
MPVIPAVDFVSQYYLPLVEAIQIVGEDASSQIYPKIWVFSSNDVDSLCSTNILVNQMFKHDKIPCLLNCVSHYNEILEILQEYKDYRKQREHVKACVLINLGAVVNIFHSLRLWFGEDLELWIFDFHRPAMEELTSSKIDKFSNNVLVISLQEYNYMINSKRKKRNRNELEETSNPSDKNEEHTSINNRDVVVTKQISNIRTEGLEYFGGTQSSSFHGSSSSDPLVSLSQTLGDIDMFMGTSNTHGEVGDMKTEKNDNENYFKDGNNRNADILFGEYCGDPSSLVILQTLDNSLTSDRIDGEVLWNASIGVSWCYINRYVELLEYELYFDLMNGILSRYTNNTDINDLSSGRGNRSRNKDRNSWPKYLRTDLSLPLYRHWNLLESVSNCEYLFAYMGLWRAESSRDSIMNARVSAGISMDDFTTKFCLFGKEKAKKIVKHFPRGFSGFGNDSGESVLTLQLPTFVKRLPSVVLDYGIHPHLSSLDMAIILHSLLTNDSRSLLTDGEESLLDSISSGILWNSDLNEENFDSSNIKSRSKINTVNRENFDSRNLNQILNKERKMELMFRDSFRVGLQLLDLSRSDYRTGSGLGLVDFGSSSTNRCNNMNFSPSYTWRHLKRYLDEAKFLLSQRFKYVKMLLTSEIGVKNLIKHNYFTLAELNDIEISHPFNLRLIGYSVIDVINKSQDLQGKFVLINKNSSSKISTIIGITPGYDNNTPNVFGAIFSKVIDILFEENQGFSGEDHYFVQDDFDFSVIRIHNNILSRFTSNLFKYIEGNRNLLNV